MRGIDARQRLWRGRLNRRSKIIAALVICVAAGLFAVFSSGVFSAPERVPLSVVRAEAFEFTDLMRRKGNLGISCGLNNACREVPGQHLTNSAWQILGLSRMHTVDSRRSYLPELKTSLKAYFDPKGPFQDQAYSFHQLYEAYQLTGEKEFLIWFVDRIGIMVPHANAILKSAPEKFDPMLVATLARQLGQAAALFSDASMESFLQERRRLPKDASRAKLEARRKADSYLALANALLDFSRSDERFSEPDVIEGFDEADQRSCFRFWARSAMYLASDKPKDFARLRAFMKGADFLSKSREQLRFSNLQTVLPCIHAFQELGEKDSKFKKTALHLLKEVVVPNWDGSRRDLCRGDGGFFADVRPKERLCDQNTKSVSDNAWVIFLLSNEVASVEVEIN